MANLTDLKLIPLMLSNNPIIKRNAMSIVKELQRNYAVQEQEGSHCAVYARPAKEGELTPRIVDRMPID